MADEKVTSAPPLTPKSIEKLRPQAKDYEVADSPEVAKGLRLRVSPQGAKIFRWYCTTAGKVITLGRWAMISKPGHITLADARAELGKLKEAHKAGTLDQAVAALQAAYPPRRRIRLEPAQTAGVLTVADVAKDFKAHIQRRRKKPGDVDRTLDKDLLPALGDRPIESITPRDVRQVVEAVVARGSPTQAGKVLAHAKQLFRFAAGRDDIKNGANPAAVLDPDTLGVENGMSQRYLSAEEIPAFWHALSKSKLTPSVRLGLKVILLTGVRTCELLRARWADVDLDAGAWVIPLSSQKLTRKQEQSARPWTVPLTPMAVDLFRQLKVLAQDSEWVMASPLAEGGHLTDKALVAGMRKLFTGKDPLLAFTGDRPSPHDLRRSVRTHLGDTLGVPWHVCERCLNHSIGKVTTIYDVGDYLDQRRAALERWAEFVGALVEGRQAKVVALAAAKKTTP